MLNSLAEVAMAKGDFETAFQRYTESADHNKSKTNLFHVHVGRCWLSLKTNKIATAENEVALASKQIAEAKEMTELAAITQGLNGAHRV